MRAKHVCPDLGGGRVASAEAVFDDLESEHVEQAVANDQPEMPHASGVAQQMMGEMHGWS